MPKRGNADTSSANMNGQNRYSTPRTRRGRYFTTESRLTTAPRLTSISPWRSMTKTSGQRSYLLVRLGQNLLACVDQIDRFAGLVDFDQKSFILPFTRELVCQHI